MKILSKYKVIKILVENEKHPNNIVMWTTNYVLLLSEVEWKHCWTIFFIVINIFLCYQALLIAAAESWFDIYQQIWYIRHWLGESGQSVSLAARLQLAENLFSNQPLHFQSFCLSLYLYFFCISICICISISICINRSIFNPFSRPWHAAREKISI